MFPQQASERLCVCGGACPEPAERVSRRPAHQLRMVGLRPLSQRKRASAFTLLELLIVIGIIAVLLVLLAPAFTTIKGGGDVTSAAYTIKGVLDTARTYAKANNTYTWVGFLEENVANPSSPNTDTPAVGRVIMSIVASKDGTMTYTLPLTGVVTLAPANLVQVGKVVKVNNVHLKALPDPTSAPPPENFDTRPPVASTAARIDDTNPPSPSLRFQYPLSGTTQYLFAKIIQFSPRGETVVTNNNYTFATISEIGVEPTHGATVPLVIPANVIAIQFNSFAGDVRIYRR
jgi:prepilin-type N-terminal cleavage/methylation domain-containing protein